MKIEVVRAWIVTDEGKARLTKAVAKQFPVRNNNDRIDAMERGEAEQPSPIGKVLATVFLGKEGWGWFILVRDELAGYAWVRPAAYPAASDYRTTVLARGGWEDDLSTIPTIIL